MLLKEHFAAITQDAVLWKSKKLWEKAENPDEETKATDNIVKLLFNIKDSLKRDRYVSNVVESIAAHIKRVESAVKDVEGNIARLTKLIGKSVADKELAVAQRKLERLSERTDGAELQGLIARLTKDAAGENAAIYKLIETETEEMERLRLDLRPRLKERDLRTYIKEKAKENLAIAKAAAYKKNQVKTHLVAEDIGLPSDFDGDFSAAVNHGLYEKDNQYYIRTSKGNWDCVSSFTMRVHYLVRESIDTSYRVITFSNIYGQERTLTVNTDDMTTIGSFKKIVNRLSNFAWQGKDEDLAKLNEFLQKDERHASQLNILGYNNRNKFWAWGNGILNLGAQPEYIPADEYGMVNIAEDKTFYLPSANQLTGLSDDVDQVTPENKFVFTDTGVTFEAWADLFTAAYGGNATYAMLWFCSALFRDVIFGNASIDRFPLLYFYGPPGSGKGAAAKSVLALLGFPQNSISLEANVSTPKGILRSFAQFKNGIVWLDEYKNAIPKNLIALLKQLYDGASYSRAKKSNDVRTESTPINASGLVSGQDMPTIEAALLERFVFLQFKEEKNRAPAMEKAYHDLKQLEASGLSSVAHQILKHRNMFTKTYFDHFKLDMKFMKTELTPLGVKERYQLNFAILLATYHTLKDVVKFPFSEAELKMNLMQKAEAQSNLTKDNNDISKFWNVVDFLVSQGLLVENRHFRFGMVEEKFCIIIKLQDAHPLYIKELRQRNDNFGLEKSTLDNYLKADTALYVKNDKVSIGSNSVWATILDYKELERRYGIAMQSNTAAMPSSGGLTAQEEHEYRKPLNAEKLTKLEGEMDKGEVPF